MRGVNGDTAGSPRVVFGRVVRHCREQAGLSQEQLGGLVYLTGDMVAKIERGKRTASEKFVIDCEALPELPTNGTLRVLWEQLREHFIGHPYPAWFDRWPDVEATARTLRWFEPLVIPGLLQTEDYARALLCTRVGDSEDDIDAMVAARMARQSILDRDKPPTLWVIMDEGVLRRCVGSPAVMKDQLARVVELAGRPDIVVQVIPFTAGAHQGLNGGAFVIADLPDGPSMAYQDTARAGQVLESPDDLDSLMLTWDTVKSEALPRAASLALIKEVQDHSWS